MAGPDVIEYRAVGEWSVVAEAEPPNPFVDVIVNAILTSPSGRRLVVPAFYDGERTWRARSSPNETGDWTLEWHSTPPLAGLERREAFRVTPRETRGYLLATPGRAWGFAHESGEPLFILGDTTYNLFGMAHCGGDVAGFLRRREAQGFNLLRVRLPVSPFHPPEGHSDWQTRRTWPWGGSEQSPRFDRFNLGYFRTVDAVVGEAEALGLGLEMIMEAWGFEFPFSHRDAFVPEWEELWLRYLIARYDAYSAVWFWTLQNEYEFYPDGDWRYSRVADLWAMRVARWLKRTAPHGHIVAVHNGPRMPPFAERFVLDPGAVDAVMFQDWGSRDEERGWLADGIEDTIARSLDGWWGSAVFAEWGYERNERLELKIPGHRYCDEEHTRRGAWRGAFMGLGIIHGFENSWGPWMLLEEDQHGLVYLQHVRRFFTAVAPFAELRRAPEVVAAGEWAPGERPLALATEDGRHVAVYLPVGGQVALSPPHPLIEYTARWFDPVRGDLRPAVAADAVFYAPGVTRKGHPQDWVLVLQME